MGFNGVKKNQMKALQHMANRSGNPDNVQPMSHKGAYGVTALTPAQGPFAPGVDPANRPLPNSLAQAPSPGTPPQATGSTYNAAGMGTAQQPRLMADIAAGPAQGAQRSRLPVSGGNFDTQQLPYPAAAMNTLSDQIAAGGHWDQANKAKAWNDDRRKAVTGALQGAQQMLERGGNAGLYQNGGVPVGAAAPKARDALAGYDAALAARAERREKRAKDNALRASQNAESNVGENQDRLRELGYLGEDEAATVDNVTPHISAPGASKRLAENKDYQDYRGRLKARREEALALRRSSLPYRQQTRGNDLNVQTLGGPMGQVQNNVQARFGGPRMSLAQGIEAAQRYEEGPDNQAMRRLAWTDPEAYGRIQAAREQTSTNAATAKMATDAQKEIAAGRNKSQETIAKGSNKANRRSTKQQGQLARDLSNDQIASNERLNAEEIRANDARSKLDREAQEKALVITAPDPNSPYVQSLAAELGMAPQDTGVGRPPESVKQGLDQAIRVAPEIEQTYGDVASWTEAEFAAEVRDRLSSSAPPTAQDLQPLLAYVQGMRRSSPGFASAPGLVSEGKEKDFFDDIINGMDPLEALKQWDKRKGNVNKRDNAAIFGSYLDYGGM